MIKTIALGFFILLAVAVIGFGTNAFLDHREDQEKHAAYAALIPLIGLEDGDDFETRVDKVRLFMFEHTAYSEGPEFHAIWGKHPLIAEKISAHAEGASETRAPLECSARSGTMESILISLGYPVRSVAVYEYGPNYRSHSFLEVQNPDTGQWHAQDPQYNGYWRDKKTGERLSVAGLIAAEFDAIEPCRRPGECSWDLPNRERHDFKDLRSRLGLASIKDYQRGKRPLFVNAKRFNLNEPQPVNGTPITYCDWIAKNCREEITIFE